MAPQSEADSLHYPLSKWSCCGNFPELFCAGCRQVICLAVLLGLVCSQMPLIPWSTADCTPWSPAAPLAAPCPWRVRGSFWSVGKRFPQSLFSVCLFLLLVWKSSSYFPFPPLDVIYFASCPCNFLSWYYNKPVTVFLLESLGYFFRVGALVWYLIRHPWVSTPHPRSLPAAEAKRWPLWAFQLQLKMASKQFSKLCFGSKSDCARSLGEIIRFQHQPCAAPKPMELTGPSWSRWLGTPGRWQPICHARNELQRHNYGTEKGTITFRGVFIRPYDSPTADGLPGRVWDLSTK